MKKISTILITHNEERNVARCLDSVQPFSDEIVLVDAESTDATVEVAGRYAPVVFIRKWEGFSAQKTFAVSKTSNRWVFWIDADEEASGLLQQQIMNLDFSASGYLVRRKARYLGRWITHGGWYPGYVLRLFDKRKGRFTDSIIHERIHVEGNVGRLSGELYHYTYSNIAHHLEKMNRYTSLAAEQMRESGKHGSLASVAFVPAFNFFKKYFLARGCLDGAPGLLIAMLDACYGFLKYAKLWEMERAGKGGRKDLRN
jgi:glycosyltransferase involved in cell wall biosynthesis